MHVHRSGCANSIFSDKNAENAYEVENWVKEASEDNKKETSNPAPEEEKKKEEGKVDPKPEIKSGDDQDSTLGNWFNKDIRSRIQVTPKGWELRAAG